MKLFAVYLGGTVAKGQIEVHDVQFVAGERIEDCYQDLLASWFGDLKGLHLDSVLHLDVVDHYQVTLTDGLADNQGKALYYVNLGAYQPGVFGEYHEHVFLVADSAKEAKARAKARIQHLFKPHKDALVDVDDCIELSQANGLRIQLVPTTQASQQVPVNDYHLVPEAEINTYLERLANSAQMF
ncbi:DUF1543 domain-containing protein [Salinibius halmophilus]|uniref:DUF1543 domain-containing protein n=1 Tax=Salinibius halmophilus TaxID=1853216 RepID=UPI000E6712CC|nr:DUF1543 domain-containing protein [Salinibius halmophilus]